MALNKPTGVSLDGVASWARGEKAWEISFLHTYSLTMFLGILMAFLSVAYFWRRQKYSWEHLQILLLLIVPSSILGARLWYVMAEGGWSNFFRFEGLAIHGGVLAAILVATPYVYMRRNTLDMRTVYGIILPNVILGQTIGRWGNFANHEVYGEIVSGDALNWMGDMKSHMLIDGAYRHPLFFYEFLTNSIGYIVMVLILLRKNWLRPGVTAAIYLIWYGIARVSMEPVRTKADIMTWGKMPISVLIASLSIATGLIAAVYLQFFDKKKYDLIKPIKKRREFFIGDYSDTKQKYLFWGPRIKNKINIWLPIGQEEKWSKREINKGKKNKIIKKK